MAVLTTSGVVRDILLKDPEIDTNEAVRIAKSKGLKVPDESIRNSIYNLRKGIRAQVNATRGAKVAHAAARQTAAPKSAPAATTVDSAVPALDLSEVLGNVALVNKIVGLCGGVENARETAKAVETCGGLKPFLQVLDLVASIRPADTN
ncbi:MAG: hypothetical protein U0792_09145 [Gemmataceae bacterium]